MTIQEMNKKKDVVPASKTSKMKNFYNMVENLIKPFMTPEMKLKQEINFRMENAKSLLFQAEIAANIKELEELEAAKRERDINKLKTGMKRFAAKKAALEAKVNKKLSVLEVIEYLNQTTKKVSTKLKDMYALFNSINRQQDFIGLDKVTVSNLKINRIDSKLLLSKPAVKVYEEDKTNATATTTKPTLNSTPFTYSTIKVEDNNVFKSLTLGATITAAGVQDYSHLICFVDRKDNTSNYKPYTVQEFQDYMYQIQQYLQSAYGIYADLSNATLKELEMNQNILLERDFNSYQHVVTYLTQNASKKYSRTIFKNKNNRFTGIDLKNKSFELKIYDKKEQLKKKKIHVPQETMRVEISVLNKSKSATKNFKKYLNTDKVFEITQTLINSFFSQMLDSIFLNQLSKEKIKQDKRIIRLAKRFTTAKDFIAQLYSEEAQSKLISLFSLQQLSKTAHFKECTTLLSSVQLTAEDDLNFIIRTLKIT